MLVQILIFDGFDELDALGPYEVFQKAAHVGAPCRVSLVTHDERATITGLNGVEIVPDGVLPAPADERAPDLLLVAGGGWNTEDRGVRREIERGGVPELVYEHWSSGNRIAAVCTGTMLLEAAGVLDDRPAVTHQHALEDLRDRGVEVIEKRVVDAGDVVTAGGITSGIDLALYLVGREFGTEVADEVAEILEYDRETDVAAAE
ncbi:DJ-1/PfpI family protein [Halobellus marinus]|uniref:DJ-1/PfpI family protein n=1 Tax=Halobellus TaxID=1073986 RepID=UPI0028AF20DC|nr:DJ-1/PfpI family protein [Halobellus sp. DFY28]